ncbi:conjugal transfer transcriptional regulator TraJ [Thauera sp.]
MGYAMSESLPTRKNKSPLKVYCRPDERERIEANARDAGMSVARFLREVGQGYRVRGIVDFEQVRELARINGDLGRLGGLLKLWLTDDVRTARFGEATVRALLGRIETTQDQMAGVMRAIVRPKAED